MKSQLLFAFVVFFLASAQASYLRVINAVSGNQVLDVYYNVPTTNEKIRLFQDLNTTDVPPYFFVTVPPENGSVCLTFMFKQSANFSGNQAPSEQLNNLPSYSASLRPGNFSYTLIVAQNNNSSSEQGNSSNSSSEQGNMSNSSMGSCGSSEQNSNYQFLLLNDRVQGDQPPSGVKFIRLVNLAPQASAISLVMMDAECPQESSNQTQEQSGNQTQEQGLSDDQSQGNETQGQSQGNQTALVSQLPYFQSSDYIELPNETTPQQLAVCYQGQKIPVVPVTMMKMNATQFSILLFTGTQQGNESQGNQTEGDFGDQDQGLEGQFGDEDQGFEGEGQFGDDEGYAGGSVEGTEGGQEQEGNEMEGLDNQESASSGNQTQEEGNGAFLATLTDDEPDMTQNVRIRVMHATASISSVTILLDGIVLFSNVSFGNATQYAMTVRGLHNITVVPSGSQSNQNASQSNQTGSQGNQSLFSTPIIAFFAWKKTYSIVIVPTGMSIQSNTSQSQGQGSQGSSNDSGASGNETLNSTMNSSGGVSQPSSQLIPGFQGPYHKIIIDQMSENSTLGGNLAYLQVVHAAPNVSAVDVSIGDFNLTNLQFLNTSHYINVSTTGPTNITISLSGNMTSPIATISENLQANTLYTLWIIGEESGEPTVLVTLDRRVRIVCVMEDESENNQQTGGLQNM